jgi:hypothetical protein
MSSGGYLGPSVGAVSMGGLGPVRERSIGRTSAIRKHPNVEPPRNVASNPATSRLSGIHRSGRPMNADPHKAKIDEAGGQFIALRRRPDGP